MYWRLLFFPYKFNSQEMYFLPSFLTTMKRISCFCKVCIALARQRVKTRAEIGKALSSNEKTPKLNLLSIPPLYKTAMEPPAA